MIKPVYKNMLEILLGLLGCNLNIKLVVLLGHFGVSKESSWSHLVDTLGSPWGFSSVTQGATLGIILGQFGKILGTL